MPKRSCRVNIDMCLNKKYIIIHMIVIVSILVDAGNNITKESQLSLKLVYTCFRFDRSRSLF